MIKRDAFGFPLIGQVDEPHFTKEHIRLMASFSVCPKPIPVSNLARAQAIAREVCQRKFQVKKLDAPLEK